MVGINSSDGSSDEKVIESERERGAFMSLSTLLMFGEGGKDVLLGAVDDPSPPTSADCNGQAERLWSL